MKSAHPSLKERLTLRLIVRDGKDRIMQIYEQELPATEHQIGLALRRFPFRNATADALLKGWTARFERKAK